MSKFVMVSDVHIHPYRIGSVNGGRDRLQDGLSAVRQALQVARERQAIFISLGDMKMPKTTWPVDALNGLLSLFEEYQDIEKYLLLGNHDWIGSEGSGLQPFRGCRNTVVLDIAMYLAKLRAIVIPHGTSAKDRTSLIEDGGSQVDMILGHAFLHEAAVGPAAIQLAAIPLEEFGLGAAQQIPVGFFGDVHGGQRWSQGRWKAYSDAHGPLKEWVKLPGKWGHEAFYPGSLYQQSWGEVNEWPKGCLYVDMSRGSVKLVPIGSPRFWALNFLTNSEFSSWSDTSSTQRIYEDCFVKFIVGPWAEAKASWFEEWRAREKPRTFQLIVHREQVRNERTPIHAGLSNDELLRGYMKSKPPQITGASEKLILEAGRRLLQ
jgi:DNA repair exonuclease SbcCD nuclease subunit